LYSMLKEAHNIVYDIFNFKTDNDKNKLLFGYPIMIKSNF